MGAGGFSWDSGVGVRVVVGKDQTGFSSGRDRGQIHSPNWGFNPKPAGLALFHAGHLL